MYPLLLAALGSLPWGALLAAVVLLSFLGSFLYTPATDVWAKVFSSLSFLKPPADGLEHLIYTLVPDVYYPAGGYTTLGLAGHATGKLSVLGLKSIVHAFVEPSLGGYVAMFDRATGKIKVFRTKDPANAGGADLPLQEVAAGVDLSLQTFVVHVYGVRDSTV